MRICVVSRFCQKENVERSRSHILKNKMADKEVVTFSLTIGARANQGGPYTCTVSAFWSATSQSHHLPVVQVAAFLLIDDIDIFLYEPPAPPPKKARWPF